MINPDTIAEWKQVIAAATPGPWAARPGGVIKVADLKYPPHVVRDWHDDEGRKCTTFIADITTDVAGHDAALIALSRTAFPQLLEAYEATKEIYAEAIQTWQTRAESAEARVRELEAEVERLRKARCNTCGATWSYGGPDYEKQP